MFKVVRQALPHLSKLSLFIPQTRNSSSLARFTTPELRVKRNQLICDIGCIEEELIKIQAELKIRESKNKHPEPFDDENIHKETGPGV